MDRSYTVNNYNDPSVVGNDRSKRKRILTISVPLLMVLLLVVAGLIYYFSRGAEAEHGNCPIEVVEQQQQSLPAVNLHENEFEIESDTEQSEPEVHSKKGPRLSVVKSLDSIEEYLKVYYNQSTFGLVNTTICSEDYIKKDPNPNVPCAIDLSAALPEQCSSNNGYGYLDGRGQPCVVLKMDNVNNWTPDPYYVSDLSQAQDKGMAPEFVGFIQALDEKSDTKSRRTLDTTWISCDGLNKPDKDRIGHLNFFFPGFNRNQNRIFMGIPNMFFNPGQVNYMTPFIFVKFTSPTERNVVINVKCQAWAKNLDAEESSVTFELLVQ